MAAATDRTKRGLIAPTVPMVMAICHMCADNHSGQSSRGYRVLSRCLEWLNRRGMGHPLDLSINRRHLAYGKMVRKYRKVL